MFALANRLASLRKGKRSLFLKALVLVLITMQVMNNTWLVENTYGATATSATVKVSSGKVRSDASTSADVTFCVTENESVAILSETKGKDGKTWYQIAVGDSVGYIRSDLVTKSDKKITVSDSLVPKKTQESSSSVKKDTNKETTDNPSKNNTNSTTTNSATNTITQGNLGVIKGTNVRIRKEASTNSGIASVLEIGTIINILAEGKASDGQVWYQIKAGSLTGFVRGDLVNKIEGYTKPSQSTTSNSTAGETSTATSGQGLVKGTSVRVRDAASLNSNVLTSVNAGAILNVISKEKGSDREWYKIEIELQGKKTTGYIAADYVSVTEKTQEEQKEEVKEEVKEEIVEPVKPEESSNNQVANNTSSDNASIKGSGVRIREVPVSGNVLCQLSNGHPLVVNGDTTGDDGNKWYQVTFSYQGSQKTGYVRYDFVVMNSQVTQVAPVGSADFESSIAYLPESYKNSLRAIHASHPAWTFEVVDTGLDWNDALKAESSVGKNLVSKNSIASWKSTAAQAYDWKSNTWYTFDGGSWVSASPELIAYYMDPRNFLTESGIYQFENLDYKDTQKKESVSKMLSGTFMSGDFTDADGTVASYAEVFATIGQMVGVSPYLLAGRAIQEQGIYGKSNSIAGNVPGYEGYFNYFNIGAYAYSGRSATTNGLIYAMGSEEASYRPWNTRIKAIYGGSKYIAEKYVSKGQNTLYFQKFNVVNKENTIYSHQYMSNIQAASSESARLQLAYLGDDEALTFRIPVYRNMPETPCAKPTSDSNPNTYLATLSVDGYELMPQFSGVTENYTVNVNPDTEYVNISASAVVSTSAIGGTGTIPINPGTNNINVGVKAQNGSVKMYTLTIQR